MSKKLLTVLGHPRSASLCGALAEAYVTGAAAAGADTRTLRVADLRFDPAIPADGEDVPLDNDLANVQDCLRWADHVTLIYPIWWGAPPGLLKSMLERVLLPGFAYKYRAKGLGWDRLLAGRTAELLVTMDSPPLIYRWGFGAAGDRIMKGRTLGFCGLKPVRATHFGPVRTSSDEGRKRWVAKANALGRSAAA
jgi:NAD(P)H dehydrogenase (quinone)